MDVNGLVYTISLLGSALQQANGRIVQLEEELAAERAAAQEYTDGG